MELRNVRVQGSNGEASIRLLPPMPWEPYIEALPPLPWEHAIQQLADATGFTTDNLRYTMGLLVAIPVGFLFKVITKDPYKLKGDAKLAAIQQRHLLCTVIGLMFMFFAFGYEIAHALFSSTVAFILLRTVPAKHVHLVVSVWAMGYMSCSHIYRQIVAYGSWTIDFTTPQLLLTQKFMNIAFALHDSSRNPKELTDEQAKRVISKPLSAREYYGYIFCMHTLLAGPSTDYNDYITWIDGSKLGGQFHSPIFAVIKRIFCAVFCVTMFIGVGANYPVANLGLEKWLASNPWWYVLLFNQFALALARHRYYFAWVLSDAACNAAGLGFNGIDAKGNARWDGVLNIKYLDVEVASNFRSAMTGWNIATSNWLRRCVYDRVPSAYRTFSSFTMSALWHGFYPGYYMTFCSSALWNEVARIMRRHVRPLFIPDDNADNTLVANVYHVLSTVVTMMSLNYLGTPFQVQSLEASLVLWKYWFFAPHIIAIALYFLVPVLLPIKKSPKKSQ